MIRIIYLNQAAPSIPWYYVIEEQRRVYFMLQNNCYEFLLSSFYLSKII